MAAFRREGQGFHKQPVPRLRPAAHDLIGRKLKLHYEELQQPLPERWTELLDELDRSADDPATPRRN